MLSFCNFGVEQQLSFEGLGKQIVVNGILYVEKGDLRAVTAIGCYLVSLVSPSWILISMPPVDRWGLIV